MRVSTANLAVVLLTAAVLRFWGLGHDIPHAIGADESEIVTRVVTMMKTGDFNPHFFDHPGLIFYVHLAVAIARFAAGAVAGHWTSLDQVGPADFYLWARGLTALLGVATVFVLHQVGLRWGTRHALLGAGLLAVMPLHVRESHFALADVPATSFATLTLLLSLAAHEQATSRAFFRAGVVAGLTVGTRYNAAVVLLLPLVAAWMTLHAAPSRLRSALAILGGALLAYLAVAPYSLLDLPSFLDGFARLAGSHRSQIDGMGPGWMSFFTHLRMTMGWPALLLLVAGLVLGAVRAVKGPGRVRWTLLVLMPVVYLTISGRRSPVDGRYLLPMLPFACLLAAVAVVSGVSLLRRFDIPRLPRRLLITGLTVAALLPPLIGAIEFDRRISRETRRIPARVRETVYCGISGAGGRPQSTRRIMMPRVRGSLSGLQTGETWISRRRGRVVSGRLKAIGRHAVSVSTKRSKVRPSKRSSTVCAKGATRRTSAENRAADRGTFT